MIYYLVGVQGQTGKPIEPAETVVGLVYYQFGFHISQNCLKWVGFGFGIE